MAVLMRSAVRVCLWFLLAAPAVSHAHKVWLLPSQTQLANAGGWITVDGAVSNDLFYYSWYPLQLDGLTISAPDSGALAAQNTWRGKYRSTFELELKQQGTYRIAVAGGLLMAFYELGGEPQRWRGMPEDFARAVPANAENLEVSFDEFRIETFVTVGRPTGLKSTGRGLELDPVTHPNDLVAGEPATFRFLLDGKPAPDLAVTVVPGNTRYRDTQDEMTFKTDAMGEVTIRWPAAGMYWLEAAGQDEKSPVAQTRKRYVTYISTLEVLN
jgi:hypothetical protein